MIVSPPGSNRRTYISLDIDGTLIPERTADGRTHTEDDVLHFCEQNPILVDELTALLRTARERDGRVVLNSGRYHEFCKIVAEALCGNQVDAIISEIGCGTSWRDGVNFTEPALSSDIQPRTIEALNGVRSYINHEVSTRYGAQTHPKRFMLSFTRPPRITAETFDKNVRRLLYDRLPQIIGLVKQIDAGAAVDFVPVGASKGAALLRYIERSNERRDQVCVVAAGDSSGDLPAFAIADIVIMAHEAPHKVRRAVFQKNNFLACTGQAPHLRGIVRELARFIR